MKDRHVYFELHCCDGWVTRHDLLEAVQMVIYHTGYIPLGKSRVKVGERKWAYQTTADVDQWFSDHYHVYDDWDMQQFSPLSPQEQFVAFVRPPLQDTWRTSDPVWGAVEVQIIAQWFGGLYNHIIFSSTLYGRSLTFPNLHTLDKTNALLTTFQSVAFPLIEHLRPRYALITDHYYMETHGRDILSTQLKYIHWCNYFGPPYTGDFGEYTLIKAPGWRNVPVQGGVWYQLTDTIDQSKEELLRQDVLAYFRSHGVEDVEDVA